jgi:hypothetical protein
MMEVTDATYAAEIQAKMDKLNEKTEKKKEKAGTIVSMVRHIETRDKRNVVSLDESYKTFGRAGNRIYGLNKSGRYILLKKCKNSTKAKRLFAIIEEGV